MNVFSAIELYSKKKMMKMVKSVLCIFYCNKKGKEIFWQKKIPGSFKKVTLEFVMLWQLYM